MGTGVLLIALSIINTMLLIGMFIMFFTPLYSYAIALLPVIVILYLIISITFFKQTKRLMNKEKEHLIMFSTYKIKEMADMNDVIEFKKISGQWICSRNENVRFVLNGYMFQKSFIIAWIIRKIRYGTVSNQLNLIKLFKFKLKVTDVEHIKIRFVDGLKCDEYTIVEKYVSKNTFLSRSITKSKYYLNYLGAYTYKYLKKTRKINEEIYLKH